MSKAGKREYATSSDRNDADAEVTGDGSTEDEPEGIDTRHVVELRAFEWSSKVFDEACEAACVSEDRGDISSIARRRCVDLGQVRLHLDLEVVVDGSAPRVLDGAASSAWCRPPHVP